MFWHVTFWYILSKMKSTLFRTFLISTEKLQFFSCISLIINYIYHKLFTLSVAKCLGIIIIIFVIYYYYYYVFGNGKFIWNSMWKGFTFQTAEFGIMFISQFLLMNVLLKFFLNYIFSIPSVPLKGLSQIKCLKCSIFLYY